MLIYNAKNYQDLSQKAANIVAAQIILKPDAVLGLATGSTPIGLYKNLVDRYQKGDLDFSKIKTINLDEYKNLPTSNPQSYGYFMAEHLLDHININAENTFLPHGTEQNIEYECARYNHIIESLGGIELQLLGLGINGHIGFNEPGSCFEKETHCVALSEETIQANARFFSSAEEVPTHAYSIGKIGRAHV